MTIPHPTGVFLDTSGLYAALDRSAARHGEAAATLERLLRGNVPLLATVVVIAEFHGLVLSRLGPDVALDAIDRLLASPRVDTLSTGATALRTAVDFLRTRPGRRLSLVDALSFAAMRDQGVGIAFTLDGDFTAEGVAAIP
jgi:predicted nucleic acid-binding protein